MIRSSFPLARVLLLPFVALLVLYLLVIGGGSAWLLYQARQTEAEILTRQLDDVLAPLADRLVEANGINLMSAPDSWLQEEVTKLFTAMPELRQVAIRDLSGGHGMRISLDRQITGTVLEPLTGNSPRASDNAPASERLHSQSQALFTLSYDLREPGILPMRMDFAFERAGLVASVQEALQPLIRATVLFSAVGAACILTAFGLSLWVGRAVRRIEAHYQELYGRNAAAELTAAMVHDLRNPLMAVRTNLRALQVNPEQTDDIVDEIDKDLVSLGDRLTAFLDLTRKRDDRWENADLAALIRYAGRLAEPALSKRGLQLKVELGDDLPKIQAVEGDLRDALLNLLVNAAESGQQEGAIRVAAVRDGEAVQITVEDRGAGIASSTLPRLFEAFFTTKSQGYGLGLAIVHRIVEAHHGSIRAENRGSGGARFVIRLPIEQKGTPEWWKQQSTINRT